MEASNLADEFEGLNLLRYKYPGLCAYNFEELLDVVLEEVVGDNDLSEGIFGKLDVYGLAVEEQGRKTLHAHILIYIRGWNNDLRALQSSNGMVRQQAAEKLAAEVDEIMSTSLVPGEDNSIEQCPVCKEGKVEFVDAQKLRNLRHKHGLEKEQCVLCACKSCKRTFTGDELAMRRVIEEKYWDLADDKIKALVAVEILKSSSPEAPRIFSDATVAKINHRFNNHLAHHTRTCFKKGEECRANLPDMEESKTCIVFSEKKYTQYDWKGKGFEQHNVTVSQTKAAPPGCLHKHPLQGDFSKQRGSQFECFNHNWVQILHLLQLLCRKEDTKRGLSRTQEAWIICGKEVCRGPQRRQVI